MLMVLSLVTCQAYNQERVVVLIVAISILTLRIPNQYYCLQIKYFRQVDLVMVFFNSR
jgi:hypothetical protein